ncbi:hypothetical protein GCM10022265_32950 [Marinobacter xestospongiae]
MWKLFDPMSIAAMTSGSVAVSTAITADYFLLPAWKGVGPGRPRGSGIPEGSPSDIECCDNYKAMPGGCQ